MASVGGCCPEEDGACVPVVPGAEVGPEPASVAAKLLVTASISVAQGPALAELEIHGNSAKLMSMRIRGVITFPFDKWLGIPPTRATSSKKFNVGYGPMFRELATVSSAPVQIGRGPWRSRRQALACASRTGDRISVPACRLRLVPSGADLRRLGYRTAREIG